MTLITQTNEIVDALTTLIKEHKTELGVKYVGQNDERKLPEYPAVVVSAGGREKELHATHTFNVTLRCFIWVYHAKMSVGHATRSQEDLRLVSAIEALLETDCTLGNQVIFGFIESEIPGVIQPRATKSDKVIGTRLSWVGASQMRFN